VRVDIVEVPQEEQVLVFPPEADYIDLRATPEAIGQVPAARQHLPLRNFLTSINSPESVFSTADVSTKCDSPAAISAGLAYEFASQTGIVFAETSLNWERRHYEDLASTLKQLLEREAADSVRVALRISSCDFKEEHRRGFCLSVRLVAEGSSAQQAELRWGLGLARIQQALLFRSRSLKQRVAE
jgi:hypothetical protein